MVISSKPCVLSLSLKGAQAWLSTCFSYLKSLLSSHHHFSWMVELFSSWRDGMFCHIFSSIDALSSPQPTDHALRQDSETLMHLISVFRFHE